ncbi:MAG: hypothetical protein RIM84_17140 [Alphaproteobacteria bacterium]
MTERMPIRKSSLTIKELSDEVLVLDSESKEIHCLNQDAGIILEACDGRRSVAEVCETVRGTTSPDDAESLVWGTLAAFESKGLLAPEADAGRRAFLMQSGMAAAAAALLVESMVTPAAAETASVEQDTRRRRRANA